MGQHYTTLYRNMAPADRKLVRQYMQAVQRTPKIANTTPNDFVENVIRKRVGCAYRSPECAGRTFAPNGVGSFQHTTCASGRARLMAP
jgi:hypothetical protein